MVKVRHSTTCFPHLHIQNPAVAPLLLPLPLTPQKLPFLNLYWYFDTTLGHSPIWNAPYAMAAAQDNLIETLNIMQARLEALSQDNADLKSMLSQHMGVSNSSWKGHNVRLPP